MIDSNLIQEYGTEKEFDIDFGGIDTLQNNKIDLNEKLGGIILKIALSLINIVFLVAFMLLLYIDETK